MRLATPAIVVKTLNFKFLVFQFLRLGYLKLIIFFVLSLFPVDCRETERSKRTKRPRAPEPVNFEPEPQQDLENEDTGSQEKDLPEIPDNFLSPSVREYLELGKSIPGEHITANKSINMRDCSALNSCCKHGLNLAEGAAAYSLSEQLQIPCICL